jgi:transcriptional regulator with XRE-family HTH domain
MSINILDELDKILGKTEHKSERPSQHEDLSSFVKRIMDQKRLTLRQVAAASEGGITQGYVGGIVTGRYSNLTVEKGKALAKGLGIPDDDLFQVMRGRHSETLAGLPDAAHYVQLLDLVKLVFTDARLIQILQLYAELPPAGRDSAVKFLRILRYDRKQDKDSFRGDLPTPKAR